MEFVEVSMMPEMTIGEQTAFEQGRIVEVIVKNATDSIEIVNIHRVEVGFDTERLLTDHFVFMEGWAREEAGHYVGIVGGDFNADSQGEFPIYVDPQKNAQQAAQHQLRPEDSRWP